MAENDKLPNFGLKKYRVRPGMKHYHAPSTPEKGKKRSKPIRYEAGQVIKLTDDQFKSFKDKFIPIEETADEIAKEVVKKDKARFELQEAGGGKWNVYDKDLKKVLNESPMSKTEANALLKKSEADAKD